MRVPFSPIGRRREVPTVRKLVAATVLGATEVATVVAATEVASAAASAASAVVAVGVRY